MEKITPSERDRKALGAEYRGYKPRQKQPGEALPPRNDLFRRPVYKPERDNVDCRRTKL